MGHGTSVHVAAQRLYLEGASFDEIVERLDQSGTHVNRKTLMGWAKKENWETAKRESLSLAQEKSKEKAADRWTRVLKQTEELRERVLLSLSQLSQPKTIEGGVSAVVQLTRLLKELSPKLGVEGDAGEAIGRAMRVMLKHPKVGLVVEKYRDEIAALIQAELKKDAKERS